MPLGLRTCAEKMRMATLMGGLLLAGPVWPSTIPPAYVEAARTYQVPPEVVFAVALAESEMLLTSRRVLPWPWTLNVEGRPERYRNRREAHEAIQRHLAAGRTSIDIGLMQVNWHWHAQRLQDPWRALDPHHNLRVGAQILHELYQEDGDWTVVVGRYHAPADTPAARARAERYRARVLERMQRLSHE